MNVCLLFVIHSPGGANFAAPLVRKLATRDLPGVRYDVALLSPWAREIVGEGFDVAPEPEAVMRAVEEIMPDIVLYETGSVHPATLASVPAARRVGAVSVCMLDWFGNYEKRFREMPDLIMAPHPRVVEEMREARFDTSGVVVLGNPHFDRLKQFRYVPSNGPKKKIIFYSQPLEVHKQKPTEKQALLALVSVLERLRKEGWDFELVLRPHPREDKAWLKEWLEILPYASWNEGGESLLPAMGANLVVGVNSTPLYEALWLGVPTVFYRGDVLLLEKEIREILTGKKQFAPDPSVAGFNATEKCFCFLAGLAAGIARKKAA
ncbi:hypothetical protein Desku_0871 [Desulfofundulus kuznetsovii DSM 6115]|uniref:UDP-N-acetylglucosamine 2-epimerase n=1 Tax=Desulfofundulus kuznetsovii (strain DSM 6115 / VKM B-1805 / 17) TaxID=760568 RepID=A0AAU8PS11_DESK7|nr:hypothetical protein Desku_0871 [Desulfofundulus kuznetsovii DSM 6115]